jgi:hypothetical protein
VRLALAAGLVAVPVELSASAPTTAARSSLTVPRGLEALLDAVGIDRPVEPARAVLEIVRRVYDPPQRSGVSTPGLLQALATHLDAAHGRQALDEPSPDIVPLPLTAAFWREVVVGEGVPDEALLQAIVTDRRAALFYVGLAALDEPTLRFLDEHRDVAATLARDHAAAFAAFGRSLVVRDGRVVAPGGDEAADLWAHLVGVPLHDARRFVPALLGQSGGRVAYLFDSVTWLDQGRRHFILGLGLTNRTGRRQHADALLSAIVTSSRSWSVDAQPFSRPLVDPVTLLQEVRVADDGRLEPPLGSGLLSRVVAGFDLPGDPERELGATDATPDAATLATLASHANVELRLRRRDALLFAQRLATRHPEAAPRDVFVAARALGRYRLLMLTLERMDVRDVSTYVDVARMAERLSSLGEPRRARVALAQFQGALAAIERARFARTIDAGTATRLVQSLARVPVTPGRHDGSVNDWIVRDLLPALDEAWRHTTAPTMSRAETTLLRAWAGCRGSATRAPVDWEGAVYRLDRCAAETARLGEVRQSQRSTPLDAAIAAHTLVERLRSVSDRVGARALGRAMGELARELSPAVTPHADDAEVRDAIGRLSAAAGALERADARVERVLARHEASLAPAVAVLLADALTGLVYATALGDAAGRLARAPSLARRHDFGFGADTAEARVSTPWQIAVEDRREGRPLSVRGSLLALDVALAGEALWRLSLAPPARPPRLTSVQNAGFAETVALMNPWDLTDEARDAIGAAMRRGRERLASFAARDDLAGLADGARLRGWRRSMLPWAVALQTGDVTSWLAPREILELGLDAGEHSRLKSLGPWGAPSTALDGCLCLRFPDEPGWERDTGRPASGALAARSADAALVVAEFLHERGLPASLARDILAGLMQRLVDDAPALHFDDWFSVVRHVSRTPVEELEDLTAALAARGPLVPVARGRQAHDR